MKSRILLVEDEAGVALVVSDLLRAEGHSVETASDGKSGLRQAIGGEVRPAHPGRNVAGTERV